MRKLLIGLLCLCTMSSVMFSSRSDVSADVSVTYGDLNGDGIVNVMDKLYMKQYLMKENNEFPVTNWRKSADLVSDGEITSNDINELKNFILMDSDSTKTLQKISRFDGIDVSKWQGVIDWSRVRAAGIDFVMIKAGEGTQMESTFLRNINGAKAAGIQCGVYWFANARSTSEAYAEAQACVNVIKNFKLEYPVVYDFEYRSMDNNPLSKNRVMATDTILTFLNYVESQGFYSMFYSNKDFPQTYLQIERITSRFDFWYVNLSLSQPDVKCNIWQYSHTGRVDGIPEIVDLDVSFTDFKSIMIANKLNGY